jgi:hypothetical protein
MKRIRKVEMLQAIGEDQSDSAERLACHPRLFSFACRNCLSCNGGSRLLSSKRSQAHLSTQDPSVGSPNKLCLAMPPRAIRDMKLGGSSSELDGLGRVGVSSFITRMDLLPRQLLWSVLDVWGRREAWIVPFSRIGDRGYGAMSLNTSTEVIGTVR